MKTINIKGKEYITVNERLKAFRNEFKDYALIGRIIEQTPDSVIFEAQIIDDKGIVRANGFARETTQKGGVNKFAMLENAETSAWGRALGNFGIGIDEAICSADELTSKIEYEDTAKSDFEAAAKAEKAAKTRAINTAVKSGEEYKEPKKAQTLEERYNAALPYLKSAQKFEKKSVIDSVNTLLADLKNAGCQGWYENIMAEYDRLTKVDDSIPY